MKTDVVNEARSIFFLLSRFGRNSPNKVYSRHHINTNCGNLSLFHSIREDKMGCSVNITKSRHSREFFVDVTHMGNVRWRWNWIIRRRYSNSNITSWLITYLVKRIVLILFCVLKLWRWQSNFKQKENLMQLFRLNKCTSESFQRFINWR